MSKEKTRYPSQEYLKKIDDLYRFNCSNEEIETYGDLIKEYVKSYEFTDKFQHPKPLHTCETDRSYEFPEIKDNSLNAWYLKCNINLKNNSGILSGKRIAIKDNIAIANIPMMNGSDLLEGYVPEYDATVVERILASGGTIIGKTTCEDMCMSGGSHMTKYGPVKNPFDSAYTAGGSSSGSAVVVATGEADMALGGDQGGSIRIPASCCGIVGLKPTHGLVPYTGAVPIVPCLDHLGPMARNVADCKLLLESIAGNDNWSDYRQPTGLNDIILPKHRNKETPAYSIGVLKEGLHRCEQNVIEVFSNAIEILKCSKRLIFKDASYPFFKDSIHVYMAAFNSGIYGSMIKGNCNGFGTKGLQSESLAKFFKKQFEENAGKSSARLKAITLLGEYVNKTYGNSHNAKANSIGVLITRDINELLKENDFLVLPTLIMTPPLLPSADATVREKFNATLNMNLNTAIFNLTGHPAISINCGYYKNKNLPIGLQIVGKHFQDFELLNCASIFEEMLKEQTKPN